MKTRLLHRFGPLVSLLLLPRILIDLASLIAGSLKEVIAK